ncbi:MAG: DUF3127 domain-containing protein [Prevotella sp.]|nr:DUF3127 domain-containing protein [Prevotella sp.]
MEFQGRISKVLTMRQGTSARTGNEWYAQPFIFEYFENPTDRYADSVVLETFDTNIIPHLKEGMEVICGFGHKAKTITKQDGTQTTINEMRLYKIESVKGAKQRPQGTQQPAQAANAPQPSNNPPGFERPATGDGNDDNDDLPF